MSEISPGDWVLWAPPEPLYGVTQAVGRVSELPLEGDQFVVVFSDKSIGLKGIISTSKCYLRKVDPKTHPELFL